MAYGQKYLFRFESRAGRDVSIKVYKDGYSGAVIQRPIGQAPVLKKEKSGPVCGTSLSFYPECQVDQEFSEFYTSDPLEYRVDLYSGSALVWRGFITPELYSEPDVAPPYDVEVVATDGLGELKLHDYVGQGLVSIRAQLTYLLALTGISADVDFAGELNVTAQSVVLASNLLSNVKVSLDYMAGESCYDVLTLLLNTLHAEITTYGGRWLVSRETDITVTNGKVEYYSVAGAKSYYDNSVKSEGRMGVADLWPVGRMTTKIEPSKNQVTVQGPWHLANPLVNPGMTSDTGWTTPGGTTYDTTKHAYKFSNEAVGSGSRLYQDVVLSSMRQALTLGLKFVGYDSMPYASITATYTTGGAAYRIVQSSDGTLSWSTSGTAYLAGASANASDGDLSNAQELSLEIPAFRLNGSFPSGTLRFIISAHSVYACGASLEIVLPVGWQDTITVNNGARGAGDTVEVLFGRESSDIIPYKSFLQGIALAANNSNVCTSWSDSRWSNLDFLALTSRGYALSIAAPRLRSTGTVNVPVGLTAPPLVISQGQVRFWLTEWTWNLLEDELEVDALSLPSAVLSVSTEEVTVMDSTAGSSGGSSSGGGAPAYSLPVASASTLGGIKVGTNLSIDANGVLSATDTTYDDATTIAHGLMSVSDKTKLNGIASGAQVNVLEGVKLNGTALTITGKSVNVLAATAITVPTGLSAGSLSNGTIAISFASGYSIPTNANQTAWSNKYSKPSSGIPLTDLAQTVQDIINLFEREGSGTTADPYVIKAKYSLYSPYNISAGGNGGGGSGGGSAVWGAITGTLSNQTDLYNALSGKIDKSVLSTKGSIIYASATDTPSALAIGTTGQILKVGSNGVPVWGDAPATGVTSIGGKTGAITLGSNLSINASNVLSCTYSYSLPIASASTLGGIKVGTNLSINTNGVLSATDTTYESKAAASGGTAVSLVTTGEKYTWNSKQNALTAGSNITISGNTISAADTHDTNSAGTGIAVSGTRGSTIGISGTYQTYISHGESAYNSLGNYLPLSGGRMTGALEMGSDIRFKTNGIIEVHQSDGSFGCYLHSYSSGLLQLYDGTAWRHIYHSGNLTSSVIGGLGTLSNSISGTAANASKLNNTSKSAFVYATDGNTLGTYDAAENSVDNLARTMFFRQNTGSGKIGVHIQHASNANYAVQIFSNGYANTSGLSYRIKENGTWGETNNIETTAHASATYLPLAGGTLTGATDTPLRLKGSASGAYVELLKSDGTSLGFIGANSTGPVWYKSTTYTLYHTGNCNNTSTAWSASSLTLNGAITGATNITASGNVGIGTTSPTQKLQVNDGNIYIYQSSATNPAGLMLAQYFPSQGVCAGGIYADYYGNSICTTSGYTHGMFFVGGRANFDNFIFTNKDKTPLAKIDYNGNFVAIANISAGSDLRWKEHITDFDDNGILKALTPVEWDWKEGHGKGHASGFIAQDIQKIMPYAVGGSEEGGYVLNYNCFHALWAKSLQNHETRVEYLERRVKELESQLKQLNS